MRQLATIQKIEEVQSIEGADAIVKVRVKDWWCVAKKDEFKQGDFCVYFEIDSLMPSDNPLFEFLARGSKPKTMVIEDTTYVGYRLKTIKLRGQISQGLALPVSSFPHSLALDICAIGYDVSDLLQVVKYEAPIPAQLAGKAKGTRPNFIPKTDEERIQNMGEVLTGFYVTEKLDGSSVTFFKKDGVFGVCSRNLELLEVEGNTPWMYARSMDIENKIPDNFAIQGELVGSGIQGNPLKLNGHKVYFYNAYNIASATYLNFNDFKGLISGMGLETVPILDDNFSLPKTVAEMLAYADGKSVICAETDREGVVVRPKTEMQYNGERFSFKAISNKYLLAENI